MFLDDMADQVLDFSVTLMIAATVETLLLLLSCCMIWRNSHKRKETLSQYQMRNKKSEDAHNLFSNSSSMISHTNNTRQFAALDSDRSGADTDKNE